MLDWSNGSMNKFAWFVTRPDLSSILVTFMVDRKNKLFQVSVTCVHWQTDKDTPLKINKSVMWSKLLCLVITNILYIITLNLLKLFCSIIFHDWIVNIMYILKQFNTSKHWYLNFFSFSFIHSVTHMVVSMNTSYTDTIVHIWNNFLRINPKCRISESKGKYIVV